MISWRKSWRRFRTSSLATWLGHKQPYNCSPFRLSIDFSSMVYVVFLISMTYPVFMSLFKHCLLCRVHGEVCFQTSGGPQTVLMKLRSKTHSTSEGSKKRKSSNFLWMECHCILITILFLCYCLVAKLWNKGRKRLTSPAASRCHEMFIQQFLESNRVDGEINLTFSSL